MGNLLNLTERFDKVRKQIIGHHKGIAATEDYFPDCRVITDILQHLWPVVAGKLAVRIAEVAAEAVPAVDRTDPGGDDKDPPLVLLNDAISLQALRFQQRIIDVAAHLAFLQRPR